MSLGTGRPIVLRDENTIRHCRVLLAHPMASPTDVRLISLVELIAHKSTLEGSSRFPLLTWFCSSNLRLPGSFEWPSQRQRLSPHQARERGSRRVVVWL